MIGNFQGLGQPDYWLIKVDSVGKKQWDIDLGGKEAESYPSTVTALNDGYLIVGSTQSDAYFAYKTENNFQQSWAQTWLVKVDFSGNKIWDKTIFTKGTDQTGKVIKTAEGCYVIANNTFADIGGYKSQDNWGSDPDNEDLWVIKLCDSTAATISNVALLAEEGSNIVVYPNPSVDGAWQLVVSDDLVGKEMQVCDVQGRVIWQGVIQTANSQLAFDSPTGVYLLKVDSEMGTVTKRLVRW